MFAETFKLTKHIRNQRDMRTKTSWTSLILNLENGTILTRTPLQWFKLLFFYVIFFCGIACFSFLYYCVFESTIAAEKPKWLLTQPGFSFVPAATRADYLQIEYQEQSEEDIEFLKEHINNALSKYGQVPEQYFNTCHASNDYGYKIRKPCIFLKINRIIGFTTQPLETIASLPHNVPRGLYQYLQKQTKEELKQRIWISCESRPQLKFLYFPQRFYEISSVDYPALETHNTNDALNSSFYNASDFRRIVAVQVDEVPTNIKHHIRCFLWAKNIVIDYEGKMGKGLVRFSLEIKSF